jgi:hypothetical protein
MKTEVLSIPLQTMYADLVERAWTGTMANLTQVGGYAKQRPGADGRTYLYWQPPQIAGLRPSAEYIGIDNEVNRARLEAKQDTVTARKERRDIVRTLVRTARLPAPDSLTGDILAALAEAGVFRLRAAVVGSVAYQCYPGLLGVRIPASLMRTGDLDLAQFHSIAVAVEDQIDEDLLSVLKRVNKKFRAIPSPTSHKTRNYQLKLPGEQVYAVDILCPLRGRLREQITYLTALQTHAQTLKHLDFLLYQEINAVVLYGPGIPVNVPAPERYALHKLLVSQLRHENAQSRAKAAKDISQAAALIGVLLDLRHDDLMDAWQELLARGPQWRRRAAGGVRLVHDRNIRASLYGMTPEQFRTQLFDLP